MLLKHWINAQLLAARHTQQAITSLIRPVQTQRRRVGDEEVVKRDFGVYLDHLVAHARPGEIIDPGWVWGEELTRPGSDPIREAIVGFLRKGDFPAHNEEHDVEHGDLLRDGAEIWECAEDVGEDFA